ncbi:unnamed protein product, partial [Rotaria sp. Silwood2]
QDCPGPCEHPGIDLGVELINIRINVSFEH